MALSTQYGAYVPTNFIWDIQQLQETDINSPEFKELLVRLYQNISLMATVLNVKDTGLYQVTELVNGQMFFSDPANNSGTVASPALRNAYRKVLNYTSALPNDTFVAIPHGITCTIKTTFTRIYATASDVASKNYIPIPYASPTAADAIELRVDGTNVYIITGSDRTNFAQTYIVLEYLQS